MAMFLEDLRLCQSMLSPSATVSITCLYSFAMEQFEFHPATTSFNRVWSTLEPGVDELVLNEDSQTGRRTTLQRWQPGARNQQDVFIHDYVEEIFMVEGDLYDQNLQQGWEKGAYAYRKPGMRHGPFKSERGCLMFIVCIPVDANGEEAGDRV